MRTQFLIPALDPKQLNQIQAHIVKSPKPHLLNSLLASFTRSSTPQNALVLYNQMLQNPTSHDHFTFTHALKACSLVRAIQKGLEIHAHVVKSGFSGDIFIQNSLIHLYVVDNDIDSACRVFDTILYPDIVSWTSIVSGLSKCGFEEKAVDWFSSMDVKPNSATIVSLISACSGIKAIKFGKAIHAYSLKHFNGENIILNNAILDMYLKCGSLASARHLFVNLPKRDVVSWTTMVSGFAQGGFCEEAVEIFVEMVQGEEAEPNEATIVSVLSACSSLGALNLGQWVHSYLITRQDLAANSSVGNALMNMHAKCGNMDMAFRVFNMLTFKDAASWSTIISGMAMNNLGHQVLPLFSLMLVCGLPPDGITFVSLLSACSHSGMVHEGSMFFKGMTNTYGIVPQMQHYACVVDMYGRMGLLERAEAFIREMPVEADGIVWGALLKACMVHGNGAMFQRITQFLPNTKAVSAGTYALLPHSYAGFSKWDDATRFRDAIRSMGLKKIAGCSWIEIDEPIRSPFDLRKCIASAGE